ncbi:S-adenosylmethionine synthase [Anaerolineales bacterium]|nr:S-adenosylmethionine synthase [Anaerolineales bacterium]
MAEISDEKLTAPISGHFNLRLSTYCKTAAYGYFGRDDVEFPWEKTDKADVLKKAAGL